MIESPAFAAKDTFDVTGRTVVVTGGAHGLGRAIVAAFAGAGARVVAFDNDAAGLKDLAALIDDATVVTIAGDVTVAEDVTATVDTAASTFGGIDVVVNAAAVYPTGPAGEVGDDEFLHVLNVNVAGYRRFINAAVAHPKRAASLAIVNFASITFYLGFPPGLSSYITSKGAVVGLTRALARELGPNGVRVNAIAPGAFPTRAEDIIEDRAAYDRQILESQCIKRRGTVADIASAALFLGSPASAFITGQTLAVDGGWTFN